MIITAKKGKGNKIHISADDEYILTVDSDFWYGYNICQGDDITQEELTALKSAVSSRLAFNRALRLLSMRSHGRQELARKLRAKFDEEAVNHALFRLCDLGLIDDLNFAKTLGQELAGRKGMSLSGIKQELLYRGVERETAESALSDMEIDENENLKNLIERKYSRKLADEKGKRSVYNALLRLGYSHSDIKSALKGYEEEHGS